MGQTLSAMPLANTNPLLVTQALTVRFRHGNSVITAVDGLCYELHAGKTLAIVGESGAGKTVACRALLGLLPHGATVAGSVWLNGVELIGLSEKRMRAHRGRDIAIVFQDPDRALNPVMRVGRQIAETVRLHEGCNRQAAGRRAIELLQLLGIDEPKGRVLAYPHELSGGMRQRVMLALAIAARPKVLIADEATRSLDVITQAQVLKHLHRVQQELGMALIMICHDLRLTANIADDVLVMRAGRAVEYAPVSRMFASPRDTYTKSLLNAVQPVAMRPTPGITRQVPPLLVVRDLVQRFRVDGSRSVPNAPRIVKAVRGVSFEVHAGEALGLVGENGSGKSSLARAVLQIPPPASGAVRFNGAELTRLRGRTLTVARQRMQMVFQDPYASLNPTWRVASIVEEPLTGFGMADRAERRRTVARLLELVDLPASTYASRRPAELSGGECQRVAIARALAAEPKLIICDEALSSLDVRIQAQMLALFARLRNDTGLSCLFISHDIALVGRLCDRVAVMYAGALCEIGPVDAVLRRPCHPYTAALLVSVPSEHPDSLPRRAQPILVDEVPASPFTNGPGCRFHARCAHARERCRTQTPCMAPAGDGREVACHFPLDS